MELSVRVRVRAGDPDAFGVLFDECARSVYNHAFRLTGNWSAAEEVVSLTFLEAWRLRGKVEPDGGSLRPWLLGIAGNVARNVSRAASRHQAAVARLPPPAAVNVGISPLLDLLLTSRLGLGRDGGMSMNLPRLLHLVPLAALALGVGLATAAPASAAAAPATTYTITNLGSLGYGVTDGVALSANGQVTGRSFNGATITLKTCCGGCYTGGPHNPCKEHIYHAFVWSNGTMTDLGTLGGNFSAGNAINLSGEVVGSAQTSTGLSHAVLWNGGKITDLSTGALSGLSGPSVAGINDSGQIVGTDALGSTGHSQLFLDSNGTITQLPLPSFASASKATGCSATAINNNGVVLGGCDDASSDFHGVVWQNGTPTDLGTLGGPQTEAAAINNNGQVTGFSQTSTDADHGFLWSNGKMTDLGLNFFPAAINDNGVIIGGDEIYSGGTLQNLNNLIPAGSGYQVTNAVAINDNGQILAQDGGEALLLTPS